MEILNRCKYFHWFIDLYQGGVKFNFNQEAIISSEYLFLFLGKLPSYLLIFS